MPFFKKTKCFYGRGDPECPFLSDVVPFLAFSTLPIFKSRMNPVGHIIIIISDHPVVEIQPYIIKFLCLTVFEGFFFFFFFC